MNRNAISYCLYALALARLRQPLSDLAGRASQVVISAPEIRPPEADLVAHYRPVEVGGTFDNPLGAAPPIFRPDTPFDKVDDMEPEQIDNQLTDNVHGQKTADPSGDPIPPAEMKVPGLDDAGRGPDAYSPAGFDREGRRAFGQGFFEGPPWPIAHKDRVESKYQKYFDQVRKRLSGAPGDADPLAPSESGAPAGGLPAGVSDRSRPPQIPLYMRKQAPDPPDENGTAVPGWNQPTTPHPPQRVFLPQDDGALTTTPVPEVRTARRDPHLETECAELFQVFDKNLDGQVTRPELSEVFNHHEETMATMDEMLQEADLKVLGQLTFDEFCNIVAEGRAR